MKAIEFLQKLNINSNYICPISYVGPTRRFCNEKGIPEPVNAHNELCSECLNQEIQDCV